MRECASFLCSNANATHDLTERLMIPSGNAMDEIVLKTSEVTSKKSLQAAHPAQSIFPCFNNIFARRSVERKLLVIERD